MDFRLADEQQAIRDSAIRLCAKYDDDYWFDRDHDGKFPIEFVNDVANAGGLGIAMPEE